MRAAWLGVLVLASTAWTPAAQAQPTVAPATAPTPTPTPTPTTATATATATAPAPAPAPAPVPPFPPSNGKTADLLSPTFGNPHPHVTPGGSQRTWAIVSGVVGAVFIGTGFGWSALAQSLSDKTNAPGKCVNDVCTAEGLTERSDARTVGDVATASFVGGGLLVGTGVLLFLTAASPNEPPGTALQLTPGGLRLRGTW